MTQSTKFFESTVPINAVSPPIETPLIVWACLALAIAGWLYLLWEQLDDDDDED